MRLNRLVSKSYNLIDTLNACSAAWIWRLRGLSELLFSIVYRKSNHIRKKFYFPILQLNSRAKLWPELEEKKSHASYILSLLRDLGGFLSTKRRNVVLSVCTHDIQGYSLVWRLLDSL